MRVKYVLLVVTNAAEIGPNNRPTGFFFPEIAHPSRDPLPPSCLPPPVARRVEAVATRGRPSAATAGS